MDIILISKHPSEIHREAKNIAVYITAVYAREAF